MLAADWVRWRHYLVVRFPELREEKKQIKEDLVHDGEST